MLLDHRPGIFVLLKDGILQFATPREHPFQFLSLYLNAFIRFLSFCITGNIVGKMEYTTKQDCWLNTELQPGRGHLLAL